MDTSKSKGLDLLPEDYPEQYLPKWVVENSELRDALKHLPEPQRRALLWTIAMQHAFESQELGLEIPDFRFASYGFADPVYEEDAFGVLAYTALSDSDEHQKHGLQFGKYGFPIFVRQSLEVLHGLPQVHPANGTTTCWAQSKKENISGKTGLLTAQHLFTGSNESYEPPILGSGVETTHGQGTLIDIGPGGQGGIDAALVELPAGIAAEGERELACQNFVAQWTDVTLYGRSGVIETKINEVSSSFGSLDYRIPLRVFLAYPGEQGDSGSLVMDSNGMGVAIYMGGMFIKTSTNRSTGQMTGHMIGLCQHLGQAKDVMKLELFQ